MSNSFGHCKIYENGIADKPAKNAIVSGASEQKYSTILDKKKHIRIITQNIGMAKSLVKPIR